jgi:hypothetical protein
METVQSSTARRSAASKMPAVQLSPSDPLSQMSKHSDYGAASIMQPTPAVVSSVLSPPSDTSDGLNPLASSVNSGSSTSSAASGPSSVNSGSSASSNSSIPPYQHIGYLPNSEHFSNSLNSALPMHPLPEQQLKYMGRPLYSPSIYTPLPLSMPQQSPLPAYTQHSPTKQPPNTASEPSNRTSPVSAQSHPSMAAPQGYHQRPYSGYNPPGPIMSNVHSPGNQMTLVGGMNLQSRPHQMGAPMYAHHPGQQQHQNDRLFKCDQCPRSFYSSYTLKRHKRIHLAVKSFPCGHCEKSFSRKDVLKVRSHKTNEGMPIYSEELELIEIIETHLSQRLREVTIGHFSK